MQQLDVISVNIWQILISLSNLLILCLIIKKFLYKPVKTMMEKRKASVDEDYAAAAEARESAEADRIAYKEKLDGANETADAIVRQAKENAEQKGGQIVAEAEQKAAAMMRRADEEIELEKRKAVHELKGEIADLSVELTKKLLEREVNADDQRGMIDQFIEGIGGEND